MAPTLGDGTVEMIVSGWTRLSYKTHLSYAESGTRICRRQLRCRSFNGMDGGAKLNNGWRKSLQPSVTARRSPPVPLFLQPAPVCLKEAAKETRYVNSRVDYPGPARWFLW
jgi:hypothetical protein